MTLSDPLCNSYYRKQRENENRSLPSSGHNKYLLNHTELRKSLALIEPCSLVNYKTSVSWFTVENWFTCLFAEVVWKQAGRLVTGLMAVDAPLCTHSCLDVERNMEVVLDHCLLRAFVKDFILNAATWYLMVSYYRRPGLLIAGDVMMALAAVVPYSWDYHGHWLKFLSFTLGKSFLFFLEKTDSLLIVSPGWQAEYVWMYVKICDCFAFFALTHKFISSVWNRDKSFIDPVEVLQDRQVFPEISCDCKWDFRKFFKTFFTCFTYLPANAEYLKIVRRFHCHSFSAFTQYLLVHSYVS